MGKKITKARDLDALPTGSVIRVTAQARLAGNYINIGCKSWTVEGLLNQAAAVIAPGEDRGSVTVTANLTKHGDFEWGMRRGYVTSDDIIGYANPIEVVSKAAAQTEFFTGLYLCTVDTHFPWMVLKDSGAHAVYNGKGGEVGLDTHSAFHECVFVRANSMNADLSVPTAKVVPEDKGVLAALQRGAK